MYMFEDRLQDLKAKLPLNDLIALEAMLPRLRTVMEARKTSGDGRGPAGECGGLQRWTCLGPPSSCGLGSICQMSNMTLPCGPK